MTKQGWKTVILREETIDRVKALKEERDKDQPRKVALGAFLEELLWPVLEGQEILRKYGPFLSKFAIEPSGVFIRDHRINRIVELVLRDGALYCMEDERFDCVHVGFAWALPEVYKAMNLHGKKQPVIK